MPATEPPYRCNIDLRSSPALSGEGERFIPGVDGPDMFFEHMHRYVLAARLLGGRRVIDAACGEGYGSAMLASAGATVLGVDRQVAAVTAARAKYGSERLSFAVADVNCLPAAESSLEAVVSFETLEHVPEPARLIAEFRRVLKSEGILVVSTPDLAAYAKTRAKPNPHHLKELEAGEFAAILREHFAHVAIFGQRVVYGSLVVPLQPAAVAASPPDFVRFDRGESVVTADDDPRPVYLLALCSQMALRQPSWSLMEPAKLHNPVSSLLGGMAERDRRIKLLAEEIRRLGGKAAPPGSYPDRQQGPN